MKHRLRMATGGRTRLRRPARILAATGAARAPTSPGADPVQRTIEFVTLIVIIAGLWLAWDQARQLNESLEISNQNNNLSTWSTVSTLTLEVDKVMIENPQFIKFIFDKERSTVTDPAYGQAQAIGTMYLDYFDSVMTLLKYMDRAPDVRLKGVLERQAWNQYFVRTFESSPLLCDLLSQSWKGYGVEIRRIGGAACLLDDHGVRR